MPAISPDESLPPWLPIYLLQTTGRQMHKIKGQIQKMKILPTSQNGGKTFSGGAQARSIFFQS